MEEDEIVYNAFYLLLKNKYKYKHDEAISKSCTICVPCNNSLRGIIISENFINDHILKQNIENPKYFTSWNGDVYHLKKNKFKLLSNTSYDDNSDYKPSILFYEQSLNKEYRTYTILILDKPIHSSYISFNENIGNPRGLDQNIFFYKDALAFLNKISEQSSLLTLKIELAEIDVCQFNSTEQLREKLKDLLRRYWARTMLFNSLELQRDARFQRLLSKALEIFVMHYLHQEIYASIVSTLGVEDTFVKRKLEDLRQLNITTDQLGFAKSIELELSLAVDEFSRLNNTEGPWEKFVCFRNCLDFTIAEFKRSFADIKTTNDKSNNIIDTRNSITLLSMESLIYLLVYVIVKSTPMRLVSDLHYVQNFLWSVSSDDSFAYILAIYKAALSMIYKINLNNYQQQKGQKRECHLKNIMKRTKKNKHSTLNGNLHSVFMKLEKFLKSSES